MEKFGGDLRWGTEKVACWRTKAAISLKRVKIEEKLLWTAYRNPLTLFRMVPSQTPYGLPFPKIGGSQPPPKNCNLKFRANDSPTLFRMVPSPTPYVLPFIKIGGLQLSYPPLISATGKATDFKFGGYIYMANRNNSPLKI